MLYFHAISRLDGSELDGVHLLWAPPYPTGHSLSGFTIERRKTFLEREKHCFTVSDAELDFARRRGVITTVDAVIWARPHNQVDPLAGAWTYRFDLTHQHRHISINGAGGIAAFAGRSGGRIHESRWFVGSVCELTNGLIESIWIVTERVGLSFTVCGDLPNDRGWDNAETIVTELQVPFQRVNTDIDSIAEEKAVAHHRAAPELLEGDWEEISLYGNTATSRPFGNAAWRATTVRPGTDGDEWEITPFGLIAATTLVPAWHRALGFAHLDRFDLSAGESYDYRITGTVYRADRDEQRADFHSVPWRLQLPAHFRLGDIGVWCAEAPVVLSEQEPTTTAEPIRKGIIFSEWIRVSLPRSTTRVVLDGSSSERIQIIGSFAGADVASIGEVLNQRTEVDFGVLVDEIRLIGKGFFVAVVPRPVAAALDPFEPVQISAVVLGVKFEPTPGPQAPDNLTVVNLGDVARTARTSSPDFSRGFEVSWEPPAKYDKSLMTWWPVDANTASPTDIARFQLERKWGTLPFAGRDDTDGFHIAGRNADPLSDIPEPGFDVLRAFPPANQPGLASDEIIRAIDVLPEDGIEFGEHVTYQIRSIDAIGRLSEPVMSAPTQLQKFVRPPPPSTPPRPAEGVSPVGVMARLLQTDNPDLSAADVALSGGNDVVVVSWGWGPDQRQLDPYVSEFRVYEYVGALLEVGVEIMGSPVARSDGWELPIRFQKSVAANLFVGQTLPLNHPYVILAHGTGPVATMLVKQLETAPSIAPRGNSCVLTRTDGAELDPAYWDARVLVEPRAGDPADPAEIESYSVTIPASWINVDASRRLQRASIGVSAADAEDYRTDRRAAVEESPRFGNESTVAAVEVVARHRGRPRLTIADLGPIESLTTGRLGANEVSFSMTPAAFLPSSAVIERPMRLERVPATSVLSRINVAPDVIQLLSIDGSLSDWELSTGDEALFRSEHVNGPVSDRFLAHAASVLDGLEEHAFSLGDVDPTGLVIDILPNTPSRWVYRLRSVDAAGKLSIAGQILQMVVRIPTSVRATSPELVSLDLTDDLATLTVRDRADSGSELLIFHSFDSRLRPAYASLATVRNRPDLPLLDRFVVRDDRGEILIGEQIVPAADSLATATFTVPAGKRFHAWAVSVSDEGIPSRLIGPLHTANGFPPEIN